MLNKEGLEEVNSKMNTLPIDKGGKKTKYVMVNERVKAFRSLCPGGAITTEIIGLENGVVTMKAEVKDECGNLLATGLAQEKETNGFVNKTSYIENCETSAVGRALGFCGIGIDGSLASAEEVANAILNQGKDDKAKEVGEQLIDNVKVQTIIQKCVTDKVNGEKLCAAFKVENFSQLKEKQFKNMMDNWSEVVKKCS